MVRIPKIRDPPFVQQAVSLRSSGLLGNSGSLMMRGRKVAPVRMRSLGTAGLAGWLAGWYHNNDDDNDRSSFSEERGRKSSCD